MKEDQAMAAFGALSNKTRLAVLRRLVVAGPEGLSAGAVAEAVGASPSRASFHLSALAEAGLVETERRSRTIIYRAGFSTLGALVTFLLEDCCGGSAEVKRCC